MFDVYEYHFSFTNFNKDAECIVKSFDKELSDKEINKELGAIIDENNARYASLDFIKVKNK